MTEIHKIEEPTEIRNHSIWLKPSEGEDWGTLRDDVYSNKTFKPNLLCVIVSESGGQFRAYWSQAREEHEFPVEGRDPIVRGDGTCETWPTRPDWWWEAERLAEKIAKGVVDP